MKQVTLFFVLVTTHLLCAQHISKLSQELEDLTVVRTYNVTTDIDFRRAERFAFTDQGSLVAIIDNTLACYRVDGQIQWQRPGRVREIKISDGGNLILNRGYEISEMLNPKGEVLWRDKLDGALLFSQGGHYLYPMWDMDSPLPLRVYDAKTGKLLWKNDHRRMSLIKAITSVGNDTLAVLNNTSKLQLLEMSTGNVLQELEITPLQTSSKKTYDYWYITVSDDGNYLSVIGSHSWPESGAIYSFDKNLNLIWSREVDSRVWPRGLTEDGSKLVVREGNKTRLYSNMTGDLKWEEIGAGFRQDIVITNEFVAIPQLEGTYSFTLAADGTVKNHWITQSTFHKIGKKILEIRENDAQNVIIIMEEGNHEIK